MKRKAKLFFRSFFISSIIVFNIIFGFSGISKAYEQIRLIGFGEYRKAIEIKDNKILFFDYEINLKQIINSFNV